MNRTPNYEDCIRFVEKVMKKENRTLYNYQKEIVKSFFEGKEIRVARGGGRTYLAKLYGLYIGSLYAENDYSIEPEVIITSNDITLELKTELYDGLKEIATKENWEIEYECKGNKNNEKKFHLDYYLNV